MSKTGKELQVERLYKIRHYIIYTNEAPCSIINTSISTLGGGDVSLRTTALERLELPLPPR
jgi:hypothetical protein